MVLLYLPVPLPYGSRPLSSDEMRLASRAMGRQAQGLKKFSAALITCSQGCIDAANTIHIVYSMGLWGNDIGMDKRSLTERDICTKFILPAGAMAENG